MMGYLRWLGAALLLGAAACDRGHGGSEELVCEDDRTPCFTDEECGPGVACIPADTPTRTVLQPLGFLTQRVFPGDEITLKVVALRSTGADIDEAGDLVPFAAQVISWSIVGNAGDAAVASSGSLTDAQGIALMSVNCGSDDGVSFQVRASVSGAAAVTFSVQVRDDVRQLELLTPATVDSVIDRRERLRVQLLRPIGGGAGIPVPGITLQVVLVGGSVDGARLEPNPGEVAEVTTDLTGIASVRFLTGDAVNLGGYQVTFCPPGNPVCPELAPQNVTIRVAARGNTQVCQYFTDCAPGYLCNAGSCELAASYCEGDGNCPPGYRCGAGRQCELGPAGQGCIDGDDCAPGEQCGGASTCIDDGGCTTPADCPEEWICDLGSGACLPDPTPDAPVVDVSGDWLTRYHFDLSDTLPGFFTGGLGPVVDFLDLVFRSQLDIDVPILGDILEAMLDQLIAEYVPPWVRTVVTVLGDFIHLFENMEVEGEMTLYQPGSPVGYQVSGEEEWSSAQFFVASFCPGGIQQFQQDPTCGQIDIVLYATVDLDYSNNDPDVGINVRPFSGQVQPPGPAAASSWLYLYDRRVDVALSQLINVLLDVVVSVASDGQWYDFEDFLADIIPCLDLQYAIEDLACDITDGSVCSLPIIYALCDAAAGAAIASLTDELGDIELRVLELGFDQSAAIHDDGDLVAPQALVLGDPDDPPPESAIVGTSEALSIFDGNFDASSWWYGER